MAKNIYYFLLMAMLTVVSSIAFTSCSGDDAPDSVNGVTLAGTQWYNNDYDLKFESNTEAVLRYRSGGSDAYYVKEGGVEAKYAGYDLMLMTGKNGYAEWWLSVSASKILMSTPSGSRKYTLYKYNE